PPVRGTPDKPAPIPIYRNIYFPVPIIVRRHWYILSQASPSHCCHPPVRGTPDKPAPIPIYRNIYFPVPIIVRRHWYILSQASPSHCCHPPVRGAKNIPATIAVDAKIVFPIGIRVEVTGEFRNYDINKSKALCDVIQATHRSYDTC